MNRWLVGAGVALLLAGLAWPWLSGSRWGGCPATFTFIGRLRFLSAVEHQRAGVAGVYALLWLFGAEPSAGRRDVHRVNERL